MPARGKPEDTEAVIDLDEVDLEYQATFSLPSNPPSSSTSDQPLDISNGITHINSDIHSNGTRVTFRNGAAKSSGKFLEILRGH